MFPLLARSGNQIWATCIAMLLANHYTTWFVGAETLNKWHRYIQEIKKMKYADTKLDIIIIAVGDFYQPPPENTIV